MNDFEEIEFRVKKAVQMLIEVCPNIQINVSWSNKGGDTEYYHRGFGDIFSRVGNAELFVTTTKEVLGFEDDIFEQ